jgi:hypothetical protein
VQELLYKTGDYGTFGTICHEYSHCFGLPDFYSGSTKYVDKWDLMDYGNNNGDGYHPCGYSAFERAFMGWLTPVELTADTTVTRLAPLNEQPQAYLIRNDAAPQEYYLLENRQQTGWDALLPGSGILVAHVDYDDQIFRTDAPNTKQHQRYTLFAANNHPGPTSSSYLAGWAYPWDGRNTQLTNTSEPASTLIHANTDGTHLMSKPLTQMSVEDGLASFRFEVTTTRVESKHAPSPREQACFYDLSGRKHVADFNHLPRGLYVVKTATGVRKVIKP